MPEREHTDRNALDAMWTRSSVEPIVASPGRWYTRLWAWLEEEFWREPVEAHPVPDPVARRIRVHRVGTRYARRLSKLDAGEASEILVVTALLLGLDDTWTPRRRTHRAPR